MTILTVTQANLGANIYGLSDGCTVFTDRESAGFWFATAPNGKDMKISKKTGLACHWGSASTSPVFSAVDFEAVEDPDAWKKADDALFA